MGHLSTDGVIDLIERRLDENQRAAHWEHMQECPDCTKVVQAWRMFLASMINSRLKSAPPEVIEQALSIFHPDPVPEIPEVFAQVVFDNFSELAVAGLRGVAHARQILLQTEDMDVHLRISESQGKKIIWGQVLKRTIRDFVAQVQVTLLHEGTAIQETMTNDLGEFRFKNVPSGELSIGVYIPRSARRVVGKFTIRRN